MWNWLPLLIALIGIGCTEEKPPPSNVHREPLALREGLAYEHDSTQPFTGAVKRTHPNGQPSTIIYYRDGQQILLRTWTPEGRLEIEQRYHQGHLALVATWDRNGQFQPFRKSDELAVEQFSRANQLLGQTNFISGFVWLQLAAYNGEPQAQRFLRAPLPSRVTDAQVEEIQRQSDILFDFGQ
tara:strand:+ start:176 stop:724 length:549 start_codon:yes stop_codon:yes gene_type:complete